LLVHGLLFGEFPLLLAGFKIIIEKDRIFLTPVQILIEYKRIFWIGFEIVGEKDGFL
jgi:hypothetical protein